MPHETVKETKNTVADPDPLVIVIVIATEIVTGIVTDVVVQDHVLVQEIAIGTNDAIVHVQETDADQDHVIAKTEEDHQAAVVAIVIVIAVQETNDHKTIIIFLQKYQPTSRPRS